MIKQLKILIKLLPSAYRFKLSLVGAAIMYLVGIVMALSFPGNGIGIVFLMMGPIWVSQLIISLSVSNLVQVSPFKKALHTYLSTAANFISMILSYLVVLLVDGINRYIHPEYTDNDGISLFLACFFFVIAFTLYVSFCYKYFIVSSIFLVIGVQVVGVYYNFSMYLGENTLPFGISAPFPLLILSGFGIIFVSSLLQYGISLLLYKRPLSKTAQYAGLRKYM